MSDPDENIDHALFAVFGQPSSDPDGGVTARVGRAIRFEAGIRAALALTATLASAGLGAWLAVAAARPLLDPAANAGPLAGAILLPPAIAGFLLAGAAAALLASRA